MKSQHCRQNYCIELLFHSLIGSWPHKIHKNNFFLVKTSKIDQNALSVIVGKKKKSKCANIV